MSYKIDLKDKKLLYELDLDSKQSYGQLARKIGLSKNAVSYRIQQLKKAGIIRGFNAMINVGNLGYSVFRIYLNLCNTAPKKEEEIIEFLKSKKMVTWVVSMDGKYNIAALILTNSLEEVHLLWHELIEKYINYFNDRMLTIITNSYYFPKAYLCGIKRNDKEIALITEPKELFNDRKDIEIIKILSHDARTPIIDIAEKLKITPKTVIRRIKDLKKNKIIVGYKTSFDLQKLGYQSFKVGFILLRVTDKTRKDFLEYCKNHPNIVYQEMAVGGDDFEIEIQVENMVELRKVIDDIKDRFSDVISDYNISHVYHKHKSVFFPIVI